jgi:hypothetical protein
MTQPLVDEPRPNSPAADRFAAMALRISHNADQPFGGAVVVVPPGGGEAIEILMLDGHADPAIFWGNLKTKIDFVLMELDKQRRNVSTFGR